MRFTKFFSVVERDLEILNPTSHEKLMLLADYCSIRDGDRVLDVGSGKGYMLRQWAKRFRIEGTGLEINPSFVAQARSRASAEAIGDAVAFVEGDAKDFVAGPEGYDAVACIGAPFAIGSFEDAVGWMWGALKPSGVLAVGDVFLRAPLPEEAAEREGAGRGDYRTLEPAAVLERHRTRPRRLDSSLRGRLGSLRERKLACRSILGRGQPRRPGSRRDLEADG
jgi:SAM-dependent methyltransferase